MGNWISSAFRNVSTVETSQEEKKIYVKPSSELNSSHSTEFVHLSKSPSPRVITDSENEPENQIESSRLNQNSIFVRSDSVFEKAYYHKCKNKSKEDAHYTFRNNPSQNMLRGKTSDFSIIAETSDLVRSSTSVKEEPVYEFRKVKSLQPCLYSVNHFKSKYEDNQYRVNSITFGGSNLIVDLNLDSEQYNDIKPYVKFDHPFIMKFRYLEVDKRCLHLIVDHFEGESLKECIQNLSLSQYRILEIMRMILSGVKYMHKNSYVHSGITPSNILFIDQTDRSILRIINNTLARLLADHSESEGDASFAYLAPERVINMPYNEKADIWSCGVVMYYMMSKELPFRTKEEVIFKKLNFKDEVWRDYDENIISALKKMLSKKLRKRPSADELLSESWLKVTFDISVFENSLKNAVSSYITAIEKNKRLIKKLSKIFLDLDADKDEILTLEEFQADPQHILQEIPLLQNALDIPGASKDAKIHLKDLINILPLLYPIQDEYLKSVFNKVDPEGNGAVDFEALLFLFKENEYDDEELSGKMVQLLTEADLDKDGKISYEKFTKHIDIVIENKIERL